MFRGMDEYQFAKFFVVIKQDEIKQELQLKKLLMENIIKTVQKFILINKKDIMKKFANQYDTLNDTEFFADIIKMLKSAKESGTQLDFNL